MMKDRLPRYAIASILLVAASCGRQPAPAAPAGSDGPAPALVSFGGRDARAAVHRASRQAASDSGLLIHFGRYFSAADNAPGAARVVVISHELWRLLGARRDAVGGTVSIDGYPAVVIGVAEPRAADQAAALLWTQQPGVRIDFVAETPADSAAAEEYRRIWARYEARVVNIMEAVSGRRFITADWADTAIGARILEAPANSGYRERPMRLRTSYPTDTKLATLIHELGHRLQSGIFRRDEEEHGYLFLWLYDVWVGLEGQAWADRQVAVERARGARYVAAWDSALSLTPAQRAERWRAIVAERTR